MYQRDYIIRMIEQMSKVLQRVLFLRTNHELQQAMELLQQAMKRLAGLDSRLVERLSADELLKLLSTGGLPDPGKTIVLAKAMAEQAELSASVSGGAGTGMLRGKAAELLLKARELSQGTGYAEAYDETIDELLAGWIAELKSGELRKMLIYYYDEKGLYAKAEDEWFRLFTDADGIIPGEPVSSLLDEAIMMYEQWDRMPDRQLQDGGLSAEEVAAGLKELKQMKNERR